MVPGSFLYSTRTESINPNLRVLTTDGGYGDGLCCLQGFHPPLLPGMAEVSIPDADSPYTYIPFLSSIDNNITAENKILDIYF